MIPSLAGTAFYLVLLPVLALVGSIALGVLFLALVEPWRSRAATGPAPSRRTVRSGRGQPVQHKDALVIHPRRPATAAVQAPATAPEQALEPQTALKPA